MKFVSLIPANKFEKFHFKIYSFIFQIKNNCVRFHCTKYLRHKDREPWRSLRLLRKTREATFATLIKRVALA